MVGWSVSVQSLYMPWLTGNAWWSTPRFGQAGPPICSICMSSPWAGIRLSGCRHAHVGSCPPTANWVNVLIVRLVRLSGRQSAGWGCPVHGRLACCPIQWLRCMLSAWYWLLPWYTGGLGLGNQLSGGPPSEHGTPWEPIAGSGRQCWYGACRQGCPHCSPLSSILIGLTTTVKN